MPHSAKTILGAVAAAASVKGEEIVSTSHKPAVVRARNIAALLMREEGMTLVEIARALRKTATGAHRSIVRGTAEIDAGLETAVGMAREARRRLAKGVVEKPTAPEPVPPALPPRAPTMSPPPRPPDPDTERARKLRRQGWTIAGIARYLGRDVGEIETMIGEKQHAFA